jgi:dipeptidase
MCDTVVAVGSGGVWLAKNSDREPGEAQLVEHLPRTRAARATVRCTHVEVPAVEETFEVVLSRPFWMWGAEMGVNERGVAIGNEAVFTNRSLDATGMTGMDLVRLALERAATAREAVDVIVELLVTHGQGGRMGYRNARFTYASSFLIADAAEAWVLETAGRRWAGERVGAGVRAISNALSIHAADLRDDHSPRDFAAVYDRAVMSRLAGATVRSACTASAAGPDFASMARALRDHGGAGRGPADGLVMGAPCAHASFWPPRAAGQTTGSMIAHLSPAGPKVWLTGTSSPCLSVFKPVPVGRGVLLDPGPPPGARFDEASLFWRHERLHRTVLLSDDQAWASAEVRRQADALEALGQTTEAPSESSALWAEHRARVDEWRRSLPATRRTRSPWALYWRRQSRREGVPG